MSGRRIPSWLRQRRVPFRNPGKGRRYQSGSRRVNVPSRWKRRRVEIFAREVPGPILVLEHDTGRVFLDDAANDTGSHDDAKGQRIILKDPWHIGPIASMACRNIRQSDRPCGSGGGAIMTPGRPSAMTWCVSARIAAKPGEERPRRSADFSPADHPGRDANASGASSLGASPMIPRTVIPVHPASAKNRSSDRGTPRRCGHRHEMGSARWRIRHRRHD